MLKELWFNTYKAHYDQRIKNAMDIMEDIAQIELKKRGYIRKTISTYAKLMSWGLIRKRTYAKDSPNNPLYKKQTKPNSVWTIAEDELMTNLWNNTYCVKYQNGEMFRREIACEMSQILTSKGFNRGMDAIWGRLTNTSYCHGLKLRPSKEQSRSNIKKNSLHKYTIDLASFEDVVWSDKEVELIKKLWNDKYKNKFENKECVLSQCINDMSNEIFENDNQLKQRSFRHYLFKLKELKLIDSDNVYDYKRYSYSAKKKTEKSKNKNKNKIKKEKKKGKKNGKSKSKRGKGRSGKSIKLWEGEEEKYLIYLWLNQYKRKWDTNAMSMTKICDNLSNDLKTKGYDRGAVGINQHLAKIRKRLKLEEEKDGINTSQIKKDDTSTMNVNQENEQVKIKIEKDVVNDSKSVQHDNGANDEPPTKRRRLNSQQ